MRDISVVDVVGITAVVLAFSAVIVIQSERIGKRDAEVRRLKTSTTAILQARIEGNVRRPSAPTGLKATLSVPAKQADSVYAAQLQDTAERAEEIRREAVADLGREYSGVLEGLGVPRERVAEFVERMAVIKAGHVETSEALVRLKMEKEQFAEQAKELMGDKLIWFRNYEEERKASAETAAAGFPTGTVNGSTLSIAIRQNDGPYIHREHYGPFDPVPAPKVGPAEVASDLREEITRVTMQSERLLAELQGKGVSAETLGKLQGYYRQYLERLQRDLEINELPPEQFRARVEEMTKQEEEK